MNNVNTESYIKNLSNSLTHSISSSKNASVSVVGKKYLPLYLLSKEKIHVE